MSAYEGFVDIGYKPEDSEITTLFYIEPPVGKSVEWAAERIAGESSIGTWTDVATSNDRIKTTLTPHVYAVDGNLAKISYSLDLFEPENVPQIMSSIAGNIFGMKEVENLRLLDIGLPKEVIKAHAGPKYGIDGIRKLLGVEKRPLVGTIVKPKLGLDSDEHAQAAYNAWVGGCDVVKDDENLTSQPFNPFEERIVKTLEMRDKAEAETGEKKVYMPNITAETNEMLKRGDFVVDHGGRYLMIDVVTLGFSAVQTVRDADFGLVLHAHRAMHGAITRNKKHGITMLTLAKLYRLIGVDQLHIGTAVGKMEGDKEVVGAIQKEIILDEVPESPQTLNQKWYGMKSTFPVCSGGLHPGHIPQLLEFFGNDIIIQAGGGVHGHPQGTTVGATAMRQAVDATLEGTSLDEYIKTHDELKQALEKFQ